MTELGQSRVPIAREASLELARVLVAAWNPSGNSIAVTWLNHFSVQLAEWRELRVFRAIGIDGTLLQLMLKKAGMRARRTSADMVVPFLLSELGQQAKVALIGGAPGVAARASSRVPNVVIALDGFAEASSLSIDDLRLRGVNVVLVGMGAGIQDQFAARIASALDGALILTVGGYLDQVVKKEDYFPPWIHALRLGWLVRMVREPKRLTRRYTVDAVVAVARRRRILENFRSAVIESSAEGLYFKGQDS